MTKKESKKIDDLVFDSANVRIHPDKNKKAIRDSIKQFGGGRSILIDADDIIRAGNGTAEAWQETGGKVRVVETDGTELIAVKRTDLKGAEAIAYAIADNRSAELAEWDNELLSTQLKELDGGGFEIESMGFDSDELTEIILSEETNGLTDEDEIPEPPEPITKPGDLWILGDHRLLCCDSTMRNNLLRLMTGKEFDIIATDPPYGINHPTNYAERGRGSIAKCTDYPPVIGDDKPFDPSDLISEGKPCIIWGANYFSNSLPPSSGWLVWDKKKPENLDQAEGELAWSNCIKGVRIKNYFWHGCMREGTDVLIHPTQKPVDVIAWSLSFSWVPDGIIYDPFLGSGTTIIAAEKIGRKCYGMELSNEYCDLIVKRWENFTGKKAELER